MAQRLSHRFGSCAAAGILACASGTTALATDATVYGLNDPTTYSHGCFDGKCLCPILLNDDVTGTAEIAIAVVSGTTIIYDVTEVNWHVGQGQFETTLTGSGTYTRIAGVAGYLHRLELDLSADGAPPIPFDSGLVNGGNDFPDFSISISNGIDWDADCVFGTILAIDTSPLPEDMLGCYRADFNHDLSVGFGDLNAMLQNWGACVGCAHDITDDDMVGFADLSELLSKWGACE